MGQGCEKLLVARLRSDFKAKIARFRQIKLTKDSVYIYLLLESAELIRLGYSRGLLFASWRQACTDTKLADVGICALSGIAANLVDMAYNSNSRSSREGGNYGGGNGNGVATVEAELVMEMVATGDLRTTTKATVEAVEEAAEVAA